MCCNPNTSCAFELDSITSPHFDSGVHRRSRCYVTPASCSVSHCCKTKGICGLTVLLQDNTLCALFDDGTAGVVDPEGRTLMFLLPGARCGLYSSLPENGSFAVPSFAQRHAQQLMDCRAALSNHDSGALCWDYWTVGNSTTWKPLSQKEFEGRIADLERGDGTNNGATLDNIASQLRSFPVLRSISDGPCNNGSRSVLLEEALALPTDCPTYAPSHLPMLFTELMIEEMPEFTSHT